MQVNWSEKLYNEVFDKEKIVYLSAESKNILTTLEEGKVYVIGGLVDHNSKKVIYLLTVPAFHTL